MYMHLTVHCIRQFCQRELRIWHFQIVHSPVSRVSHRSIRVDYIRTIRPEIHIMVSRRDIVDFPCPISLSFLIFPEFQEFFSVQGGFYRDCLRCLEAYDCPSLFRNADSVRDVRVFSCRPPCFISLKADLAVYRIEHQHLLFHGLHPESLPCDSGSFFSGDIIRLHTLFPEQQRHKIIQAFPPDMPFVISLIYFGNAIFSCIFKLLFYLLHSRSDLILIASTGHKYDIQCFLAVADPFHLMNSNSGKYTGSRK